MSGSDEITALLSAHAAGNEEALPRLFSVVYAELRRLAHYRRREGGAATLDTTGLVHEAYLKMAAGAGPRAEDRKHFFNIAAQAMRQILVDYARSKRRQKRGGGVEEETLEPADHAIEREAERLLAVNRALGTLAARKPRCARVFECRYFAGLTSMETALALDTSTRTVDRDWREAKTLLRELLAQ